MLKLQEYLNEIEKDFHLRHGFEFGFSDSQSEAHFQITTQAAMNFLQSLAMSGKIGELQNLIKNGADDLKNTEYYSQLIKKCTDNYYALDWEQERKEKLAETALQFALNGLRNKFVEGGYSSDMNGIMQFLGLDSGMMGMLGKVGGFFSKFKKS